VLNKINVNDPHDAEKVKNIIKDFAEKEPSSFLYKFIDKPWAKLYIPIAAKSCAEKEHYHFLKYYINEPWAKDYIPTAAESCAEKNPYYFLKDFLNKHWAEPYIDLAAKSYAKKYPRDFLDNFKNKDWANEPIEDLDGKSFIQYAEELLKKKSSYSPRLTKLAKILRSLGLSGEASSVLRIR
jgi:hypothetical protein